MKNKLKKFVLPAFALLMAVSLAFATDAEAFLETGYIQGPTGPIQVQVDCKSEIIDPCLYLGQHVYEDPQFSTPMRKSQP
ncbi:DUF6520 family protein [Flagellimonas nanhaiensis]|uniref:Uncharacterized protein n=1 Tax=Flagellimonas nanhaiensis TaxID=2292706 RepID=A0A371JLF9_9FLAO|nr:DUF6520 family protein [Allomuricauda nanhaiensis]RDY57830.1 hypothetical protein DX873_16885 [Allomuricauda nanhaiensis]